MEAENGGLGDEIKVRSNDEIGQLTRDFNIMMKRLMTSMEELQDALKREILEEAGCEISYISEKPILALPHIVHNKRGLDWFYNFLFYML